MITKLGAAAGILTIAALSAIQTSREESCKAFEADAKAAFLTQIALESARFKLQHGIEDGIEAMCTNPKRSQEQEKVCEGRSYNTYEYTKLDFHNIGINADRDSLKLNKQAQKVHQEYQDRMCKSKFKQCQKGFYSHSVCGLGRR